MQRQSKSEEQYIRHIEYILHNTDNLREAVSEARIKMIRPEIKTASGQNDPTAAEAIKNMTPIKSVFVGGRQIFNPEKWLEVSNKVENWCSRKGEIYEQVLKSRYGGKHYSATCAMLEITNETFYRILGRIRNYAALQAAYEHLIRID